MHPDGGELSGGREEEGLFHETLKQLPVNTLERDCQSKQSPQVPLRAAVQSALSPPSTLELS